jgi:hypothetical protein
MIELPVATLIAEPAVLRRSRRAPGVPAPACAGQDLDRRCQVALRPSSRLRRAGPALDKLQQQIPDLCFARAARGGRGAQRIADVETLHPGRSALAAILAWGQDRQLAQSQERDANLLRQNGTVALQVLFEQAPKIVPAVLGSRDDRSLCVIAGQLLEQARQPFCLQAKQRPLGVGLGQPHAVQP